MTYNWIGLGFYLVANKLRKSGCWKNFIPENAIDLMNLYLSSAVYDNTNWYKSEQELIDEQTGSRKFEKINVNDHF